MDEKRQQLTEYINGRLEKLESLGKTYSKEKVDKLVSNLLKTNKELPELYVLIDNKFSSQARKVSHDNHLANLKEFYLSNIEKLKKGNNCYLLSYSQGGKILEQALVEDKSDFSLNLTICVINNHKIGYKKPNSKLNDYELIMSDIAYLLNVRYAKTYRMFDKNMNPIGILNESLADKDERFLNFEEVYQFIKEESPRFTLKSEVVAFHDKRKKKGLVRIPDKKLYKENIDYVIKMFKALPDITDENIEALTKEYLNMKVFELFTNSLNNDLTHYGLLINKKENKYTYEISPLFNKNVTVLDNIEPNETICNFFIVKKKELLHTLVTNYYDYIKEICTLIIDNSETLLPLINQLMKEHLEYDEYEKYKTIIDNNMKMFNEEMSFQKSIVPDTNEDIKKYNNNDHKYNYRICPYLENYDYEAFDEGANKGSVIILSAVISVMVITLAIIGVAIYIVSTTP